MSVSLKYQYSWIRITIQPQASWNLWFFTSWTHRQRWSNCTRFNDWLKHGFGGSEQCWTAQQHVEGDWGWRGGSLCHSPSRVIGSRCEAAWPLRQRGVRGALRAQPRADGIAENWTPRCAADHWASVSSLPTSRPLPGTTALFERLCLSNNNLTSISASTVEKGYYFPLHGLLGLTEHSSSNLLQHYVAGITLTLPDGNQVLMEESNICAWWVNTVGTGVL